MDGLRPTAPFSAQDPLRSNSPDALDFRHREGQGQNQHFGSEQGNFDDLISDELEELAIFPDDIEENVSLLSNSLLLSEGQVNLMVKNIQLYTTDLLAEISQLSNQDLPEGLESLFSALIDALTRASSEYGNREAIATLITIWKDLPPKSNSFKAVLSALQHMAMHQPLSAIKQKYFHSVEERDLLLSETREELKRYLAEKLDREIPAQQSESIRRLLS